MPLISWDFFVVLKVRVVVAVSWMKGADIIVCTVYLWFLSVLPLLPNTMDLRAMLDARRNHEHHPYNTHFLAYVKEDGLTLSVLAFSTSMCMFCLQCVRVIWPRAFRGECHSAISKIVANEWRMLVDSRRQGLLYYINATMYLAYSYYAVRITV
jgi:hypothetical protein